MSIKMNRALKKCGFRPVQEAEVLKSLPESLRERLTSGELAEVMQALNTHWHRACQWKEAEILGDRCIYDPATEKLIEF